MASALEALRELAGRKIAAAEVAEQQQFYLDALSEMQRKVILCQSKRITVRVGRRGGKTHLLARLLFKRAQDRAGAICLFLALTRPNAKRLIWGELQKVNKKYGLGAKFNKTTLEVTLPNGSQIWLAGATSGPEHEKLRGIPFDLICCDESGSMGEEFEYLLREVLGAALEDYDGTLILVGTPNAAAAGAFFERDTSTNEQWAHFHWTVLDNPNFPRWAGMVDWVVRAKAWWAGLIKREEWSDDDPVMHREWLAKWVRDANRLVYRVEVSHLIAAPPAGEYAHVIGCDLGWNDQKTIVVLACSEDTNKLIFVDCFARSQMLIDDYADTLKMFIKTYKPVAVVCDAGAQGKDIVELMRARFDIPIVAADKKHKPANIGFFNSGLKKARIFFTQSAKAVHSQMSILQWKDKYQLKEDEAFRNDLADAAQYAYRYATNVYKPDRVKDAPEVGTQEWLDQQADSAKLKALRRVRQQQANGDTEREFSALLRRD